MIYTKLTLGLVLLITTAATAQKQTPPEGKTPKDFALPAKKEEKLSNGLAYTLVQYGQIPKVTIQVVIKAGNVNEKANEAGLADVMLNLMKEGTTSRNSKELAKSVARLGGTLSYNVGSNTMNITGSVLSEYGPELVKLMADIVQHPSFPASEVQRVKNDFKRQISLARSQPSQQADEKFRSILYGSHPYGRGFPKDAEIEAYDVPRIKAFYDNNLGALRTHVYAAGKFSENAVADAIEASFKDWRKGPEPNIEIAKPVAKNETAIIDRPGAPQSTLIFGLPVIDPSQKDYLDLVVTNSILGGSFGSRITSNIRENKGYTYSPRSVIAARFRTADWSERADVTTESTGPSLREIAYEINRLQSEPPSAEELKGIQNYEAGIFVLRNSSPGGIINQLSFLDLHGLPDSYLTNQVKNIYAITPQKVQEMTRKYLKTQDMTLVAVGDKKVIEPQIKQFQSEIKKIGSEIKKY